MDIQKAMLFGRSYILESISWQMEREAKERATAVYIAETLRMQPQGKMMKRSLADILDSFDNEVRRERSAEEVIEDVKKRAGLKHGD